MADDKSGDKKSAGKEVKKVLKDDFKKSGSSGKFEKKWGLPKPPKKYVELCMIGVVASLSMLSWTTMATVTKAGVHPMQIQAPRPHITNAQSRQDRRYWLRICYQSCMDRYSWNTWQLARCRQDCRNGQ